MNARHRPRGWANVFQHLPVAVPLVVLLASCAENSRFVGQQQVAGPAAAADGISVYFNQRR
ncbi:MAG: hypothetical protein F4025_04745, partial [Synechococcus sp. SB0669_bin_7]|nr:hypothetical protein [Synechococcus sp. SB0669_bin_7]